VCPLPAGFLLKNNGNCITFAPDLLGDNKLLGSVPQKG
jgi:hypothetical protein